MKKNPAFLIFLLIFFLTLAEASAQKQTHYLFAYTQKMDKAICGNKELIKDQEIGLTIDEAATYKTNYRKELSTKYNIQNKYNNTFVELVKPNQAAIFYEGEKTYNPKTDGWDCTSTYYGCIIANDMAAAETKFAALKAEYKKSVFKEIKRWSKPQIAAIKAEDVAIEWKQTPKGIVAYFTNTRKDIAFDVTILSFKKQSKGVKQNNFNDMVAIGKHKVTLQPGEKLSLNLKAADGFNIDAVPVATTEEQEGLIQKGKNLLRQYLVDPKKGVYQRTVGTGVRS
ncbi:MAG: hypothetical protein V4663_04575 [Bacteroidota bacterium]